jgi:hypothetical protein
MAVRDGSMIETKYSPIVVIAGTETHKLALHQLPSGHWVVSDPKSGAKIVSVHGQYKGIRTSSRGLTKRELRVYALASVEALIEQIGSDKFNAVLANPKPF